MWNTPETILADLINRHPALISCQASIWASYEILLKTTQHNGTIFTCGNGGSAADAEHIVGELLKGFMKGRKLDQAEIDKIEKIYPGEGKTMGNSLQKTIRAIALTSHTSFLTAYLNDVDPSFVFAQHLYGLGKKGDALIAISTSGNSPNIVNLCKMARVIGVSVIALTGETGGKVRSYSDQTIQAPSRIIPYIQELHLPIYHALCAMLEVKLFAE